MAGLVTAIHALLPGRKDVDGRNKSGHDEEISSPRQQMPSAATAGRQNRARGVVGAEIVGTVD
jgi:hypothetical protein